MSRSPCRGAARGRRTQAHGVPIPPRAQARKQAPRSRRYRAFPWGREPNQTHTGTEGDPGNWPGRCCGPLPAQIGHDRCEQTVPAGTVCGRYLHILCYKQRGYRHDLTRTLPVNAARSSSALESAIIFARGNPCKRVASTRGFRKNGYKYMHEIKSDMDAVLFTSLGSRLK